MTQTPEEKLAQEKDGFIKTALLAYVANMAALNTEIPPHQIVAKSMATAELTWEELVKFRGRQTVSE